MSAVTQYKGAEPILYDVIEMMQNGFARIDARFEQIDGRFAGIAQEFHAVKRRLFKIELKLEEMSDITSNHEKRLITLERWRKNSGRQGLADA